MIGYLVLGVLMVIFFVVAFYYYNKYKTVRKALGKAFTELLEKGGDDGLLAFDIHDQDIDFKFIPTLQREKGFYYLQLGEGEDNKKHLKVRKSEIYFLRGRYPAIFLVNDKIRAASVEMLKSIDVLNPHTKSRILADWSKYTSLKNRIAEIEDELVTTADDSKRARLEQELEKLRAQMKELDEKYKLLFEEIDKNGAVAFDTGDKIVIIRPFDFSKLVDFMTGVHSDEIVETVRSLYIRKIEHFLKDLSRKAGIEFEPAQQGGGFSWATLLAMLLLFGGIGLIAIGLIARGLG